jgi:Tfp pilus assembly protein PilF
VAIGSLPLSELLTRGSAARRSGDNARARALLERALVVSPGNVEALSGLADMARGTGDLAGAKANYERALATSPGFSPALLGLADTEWDLGDRASAQRHYRTLIANGSSAPERAKTRATGASGTSGPAATPPAPAPKP